MTLPSSRTRVIKQKVPSVPAGYLDVRTGIVELLNAARHAAARSVNALMTASYWEIGRRIVEAEQKGKRRAGYGEQLIERLSAELTEQFGRGFGRANLQQMRQFYLDWHPSKIRQAVSGELLSGQFAAKIPPPSLEDLSHAFSLLKPSAMPAAAI